MAIVTENQSPQKFSLVIEANKARAQYWKDIWRFRELFVFLAWRDILVRYKQTAIGIAWAIIRPLFTMVVFTVVFGRLAKLPTEGAAPYAVLVFVAMLPWQFFSSALQEGSNSLVSNANLISKVYFPRMVMPFAAMAVSFVDFIISFVILIGLFVWYGLVPDWKIVTLPLFMFIASAAAMGGALWMGALNVKFRDFRYAIPFLMQAGLYVSPVGFSSSVIPEKWRLLYSLNPMVGVIDGFRWALLGNASTLYVPGFLLSLGIVAGLLGSGLWYFRKTERYFADII